jgi:hypothetical protein
MGTGQQTGIICQTHQWRRWTLSYPWCMSPFPIARPSAIIFPPGSRDTQLFPQPDHCHIYSVVHWSKPCMPAYLNSKRYSTTTSTALHGHLLNTMPIWDGGIEVWRRRMNFFIRIWGLNRISQLRGMWVNVRDTTQDLILHAYTLQMIIDLDDLQI